ncbi:serine/threonine protein kinase [Myxococcus sp. K15C18031901]|uniref:serine/threonine-protein kinase n=1 Tax=Myxococcus dinghuensis TaxID=2906761 RepID=UPI0020A7C63E|nr:serine/threonine-protein kinase [Myxococcus dinghuensis]MCP3098527.1 serine/threonine protein kinase [Myxococcus dinghuensis]
MALFICQRCETQHEALNGVCPSCGGTELLKVAEPAVDRMLGKVVAGRYRVLKRLGQGGMGSVYLAEQVGIGQQVAMKFLNSGLSMDPDVARRFLNEAKSYARVAHPNAVTLHDFGQDDEGSLYLSMEYVEGDDLKHLLASVGRLNVHEAGDIILQVADVLAFAHARGVVHRDLKPENVMVRQGLRGWHAKVLDFGIARIIDGATRLTAQGAVAGTPRYMSPEQAMGLDVDARADVYAVGVVLFELLTGVQPFDGASVAEIMQKQVHQPIPRLVDVVPELDLPAIDAVIQKATAKKRVERYTTMEAFAVDLSNALPTMTGRPPISGVSPAVRAGTAEQSRPGTMLYGDGTEDTMLRGAATPAPSTVDPGKYDTGRVAPLPLTQPSPGAPDTGLRVGPGGFNKTAHAMSPYAAPPSSRGGWMLGLGIAGALLLGGIAVVVMRSTGPTQEPPRLTSLLGTGAQPAPPPDRGPPPPGHGHPPPPLDDRPPVPHPMGAPRPPPPVQPVDPRPSDVAEAADPAMDRRLEKAQDRLIEISDDFNDGELAKASEKLALARSLGLDAVEPKLAELGTKIEDASKRLARARAQENDGNCEQAIGVYKALRKDYPQLADAQRGLQRCKRMLPPDVSD